MVSTIIFGFPLVLYSVGVKLRKQRLFWLLSALHHLPHEHKCSHTRCQYQRYRGTYDTFLNADFINVPLLIVLNSKVILEEK